MSTPAAVARFMAERPRPALPESWVLHNEINQARWALSRILMNGGMRQPGHSADFIAQWNAMWEA